VCVISDRLIGSADAGSTHGDVTPRGVDLQALYFRHARQRSGCCEGGTRWPHVSNLVPHNSLYNYGRMQEVWLAWTRSAVGREHMENGGALGSPEIRSAVRARYCRGGLSQGLLCICRLPPVIGTGVGISFPVPSPKTRRGWPVPQSKTTRL